MTLRRMLRRLLRALAAMAAALGLLTVAVAIWGVPRPVVQWLSADRLPDGMAPDYIIVLGGGGIPSESGLIRCYYGAAAANKYTNAAIVVSLLCDYDPDQHGVGHMRDELVLRGVAAGRIQLETRARNTHEQAANILALLGAAAKDRPVLLVTSRLHLRRSLGSFRRVGFTTVYGVSTRPAPDEGDPGRWTFLRYDLWQHLDTAVECARELCALLYYKARGWTG